MQSYTLDITEGQLTELLREHGNMGKNSHVGHVAVALVRLYFLKKHPDVTFALGTKGADIEVFCEGRIDRFEIKGTTEHDIAWAKLKVSSQDCYNCLVQGMTLIRVTGVGSQSVGIHFMKYGEDFDLIPEVRFAVKRLRKTKGKD